MTYAEWYTKYLQLYKRNLAPKTRDSYSQVSAAYILPVVVALQLEDVTPEHVQESVNAAADLEDTVNKDIRDIIVACNSTAEEAVELVVAVDLVFINVNKTNT